MRAEQAVERLDRDPHAEDAYRMGITPRSAGGKRTTGDIVEWDVGNVMAADLHRTATRADW